MIVGEVVTFCLNGIAATALQKKLMVKDGTTIVLKIHA